MKPLVGIHRSNKAKEQGVSQDSKAEKLNEDHILEDDGPFQWMVLACAALAILVYSCHISSVKVSAFVMNHWCLPPDDLGGLTLAQWMNVSIPVEKDGSFSRCTMYDQQSAPTNDSTRKIVSCSAWYFDLTEHGNTIISEWSIVCDRSWLLPLASQALQTGTVAFLPVLGMAADRIGRRPVACTCVAVLIITGFASALTKSFLFFVAARIAVLASASSLATILFVAQYEVTAPVKRLLHNTINVAMAFVVAPLFSILLSLLRLDWTVLQLVLMVPTSFLVATFYMVQESPRWLLATWRLKAAEHITLLAARTNRTSLDHAREHFKIAATRMRANISDNDVPLTIALGGLLRQPQHRKNALLLFYTWFAVDFAHTATTWSEHLVSYDWVPLIFVVSMVPAFVGLFFCIAYCGRKRVTVAATASTSVGTAVLVFTYYEGRPTLIAGVVLLLVKLSCSAAYTAVFIFTLELFPTVFRCIGLSTAIACANVGTIFASLFTDFETTKLRKDQLLLLIAILLMVGAYGLQMLPDTAGAVLFSRVERTRSEVDRKHALVASLVTRSTANERHSTRSKAHPRGPQTPGSATITTRLISDHTVNSSSSKHAVRTVRRSKGSIIG